MKTTFERTETIDLGKWNEMILELRRVLEDFKAGKITDGDAGDFLTSHILRQDEDGAWGLMRPSEAPGDARVDYYYIPTYLSTAILMRAHFDYPEVAEHIEGFLPAFRKALRVSTGRSFSGHGYEATAGVLEALRIFSDGGAVRLLNDTTLCPEFSALLRDQLASLEAALAAGRTRSEWEEDYSAEYEEIMARYKLLFVYVLVPA